MKISILSIISSSKKPSSKDGLSQVIVIFYKRTLCQQYQRLFTHFHKLLVAPPSFLSKRSTHSTNKNFDTIIQSGCFKLVSLH